MKIDNTEKQENVDPERKENIDTKKEENVDIEKQENVDTEKDENVHTEKDDNVHTEKDDNVDTGKQGDVTTEKQENKNEVKAEVENSSDKKGDINLADKNNVFFDGKNYRYNDSNNVSYVWDAEKNSWEISENQDSSNKSKQPNEELYGFDGTHHTYTDPMDKSVYIWDQHRNAWFPKVDDDFLVQYQMNYGFSDNSSTTSQKEKEESEESKEPKLEVGGKRKAQTQEPSWFELDDEHNTKVYVSNLPLDTKEEEFVTLMQKCGLVMKDIDTGKWKIKLYTEKDSNILKGDALCTYIKKESVDLALTVLDGVDFKGNTIKVERAKFEMKGAYNPALKPKKKRRKEKERAKKIQEKLFDWRPDKLRGERHKREKTIIIKNLFEPGTFDDHVELILEYTEDLRQECSKCGTIRKLVLYDKHPEGVAQVTFSDAEEADACKTLLHNRWFGQRRITAETWDGKTTYKVVEKEVEEKERLERWKKYLESENSAETSLN